MFMATVTSSGFTVMFTFAIADVLPFAFATYSNESATIDVSVFGR